MSTVDSRGERLPLLDGLRTFAALGVVLFHASAPVGELVLFDRMYLFVDLFFMLSGFVLALAAEPRMAAGLDAWGFLKARIRRLWPMTALGAVLGALAVAIDQPPLLGLLGVLLLALIMIPLPSSPVAIFPLNGPQWSIMWELIANYVHAAWLQPLAERTLLLIAGLSGVLMVWATYHHSSADFGATGGNWWMAAPRVAWAYILGIWFARVWQRTAPARTGHWLAAIVAPALILAGLPFIPLDRATGDAAFLILALPPLFWLAINANPPRTAEKPLSMIGALSFPLYAVHVPVLYAFRLGSGGNDYDMFSVLIAILAAILIAMAAPKFRAAWAAGFGSLRRAGNRLRLT